MLPKAIYRPGKRHRVFSLLDGERGAGPLNSTQQGLCTPSPSIIAPRALILQGVHSHYLAPRKVPHPFPCQCRAPRTDAVRGTLLLSVARENSAPLPLSINHSLPDTLCESRMARICEFHECFPHAFGYIHVHWRAAPVKETQHLASLIRATIVPAAQRSGIRAFVSFVHSCHS